MNFIDGIAILGALAWTPHLISLIKNYFTKPKVSIITSRSAELGFTSLGPILNLHLAFSVEHKDIVVSDLKIRLKHSSGEERIFEWQGIKQNVGKMTTPDAGSMPFEKEQSVLAIKLNQTQIEERFIRFQDVVFLASKKEYENKAVKKIAYLKAEGKYNSEEFLREQEMTELYNFNKHAFPWKEGEYVASIEIKSPEEFILIDNVRSFSLSPVDIEELSKNKDVLEADYKRLLVGQAEGEPDIVWQWRAPALIKNNKALQYDS
ncbi:hypothetical protein [Vibrio mediterranei]|uniref:hypothetical protein n=1 Tax=Vibrio mediterranei TaxID=689 RepID=UPI0022846B6C|nr:hypothetical protein [Vibrio mediterranei]MCY9856027.1 hypothetical protein [Vibrio mediterranei]